MSDSRLVCDASALVTVLLGSGNAGDWLARRLASADLAAPALLPFECSNVIRRHEVGGLISSDQAAQAHNDLVDLPIDLFPYEPLAQRVWQLRRNLTSYDAAYVSSCRDPRRAVDHRIGGWPERPESHVALSLRRMGDSGGYAGDACVFFLLLLAL